MAVQAGYPIEKPRSASVSNGIITAKRVFQVKTARGDKENVVASHASIPKEGAVHDVFPNAYCIKVTIDQQDSGVEWIVTCEYSSERERNEDPEQDAVEFSWDGESYTEAIFQDISGNAIVNSAGDYFIDPSPTKEKTHLVARIESNQTSVPAWLLSYRDVVNDSNIVIDGIEIEAGLAMIRRPFVGKLESRNDISFRRVSYDVHIHPDGWKLRPMDVGFRQVSGTERVQVTNDGDDEEPTTPVPLDGNGNVLIDPQPDTCVFLEYTVYEEKDFTVLPGIEAPEIEA